MSLFKHGQKTKKKSKIKFLVAGFAAVVLILASSLVFWYKLSTKAVNPSDSEQVIVVVEVGMNESRVAALLESHGLIRSSFAYELYARLNGKTGNMQAGGYKISKNMAVSEIVDKFVKGDVATDLITILPAQRLDQLRASFIKAGFSETEVDKALEPGQYSAHPALANKPPLASLEGYLYPESFLRSQSTSLETIITASLDQMAQAITPEIKQKLAERNLNLHEAIILASIVEKEVNKVEDKPTVAQVFLTRLNIGMLLGSDVTAYYGAAIAGLPAAVSTDTPYNTRLHGGLPPSPISNVSASSLNAVANPSNTDYLYFVAGDNGNTYFSKTLEEHEALAAKYCHVLCAIP